MLDSYTLYFASIAVIVVMTFLNILTWRTNKQTPGTLIYIFYPVLMLCAVVAFALVSSSHNLLIINAACSLMFAASIVHCFAISQFLDYRGPGFKLLCSVTAFSAMVFGYYSFFDPSLAGRVIASDLQHISEALFLLFIFIKYARKDRKSVV